MSGQDPAPAEERRLAAIMFTDMVGYSALTERDERLALQLLEEQRKVLRSQFHKHSGREIKHMADGFLVEFSSAVDASSCALAIQKQLAERNAKAPAERRIVLRIGLHLGDVVLLGSDVLGNGVNVAARIEKLADPGGICVSEDIARQIRNKVDAQLESMGTPEMKNITDSIEVFRLGATVKAAPSERESLSKHSIAILPFTNMSPDPENEYFGDGLTEDILTQVSKISSIKVISRTSVMQYKNTTKNIRAIGQELGVATILEGSVRKSENRVRITAQLIDATNDQHLWAETYDRELSDIFGVQSEVAEKIAQALRARITPAEKERIERIPTKDLEAYQLYLQGRFFWNKRTDQTLRKAIECFESAIARDPSYGEAYAGLADSYTLLALFEFLPPGDAFPKARSAAAKALEMNPDLAEARASLGLVKFQYDWDWASAEKELTNAIALKPNYAPGHHFYADYLKGMGRFDEALEQIRKAQELDPLSLAISSGVGHVLYLSRRYDEAIKAYRQTLELDPSFVQARLWFGRPFLQKGMFNEAIFELKQAVELSGRSTISLAVLAHAFAAAGQSEEALAILAALQERSQTQYVPSYWICLIYVGLGDKSRALDWLDKALEERSAWLAWVNVEPRFDSLREESQFKSLLAKIGF